MEKQFFINKEISIEHKIYNNILKFTIYDEYVYITSSRNTNSIEIKLSMQEFKDLLSNLNNIL
jgi:hypothetical protein